MAQRAALMALAGTATGLVIGLAALGVVLMVYARKQAVSESPADRTMRKAMDTGLVLLAILFGVFGAILGTVTYG